MAHVVSQPRPPLVSSSGRLTLHQVPAAQDNLVWVLVCNETRRCAIIDGPNAGGALELIEREGLELDAIFNTHTHFDHIGVNKDLDKRGMLEGLRVVGAEKVRNDVPGLTQGVQEGDEVQLGVCKGKVLSTEGHIDGHVSYLFDDLLFCGDTMFGAGCGYLFDGPPAKMHESLQKLAALDPDTKVCCAHEYTEDNLRFAWSIDGDNAALAERIRDVFALRGRGECSVPSTIGVERATNPFLRTDDAAMIGRVAEALGEALGDAPAHERFGATRRLKDRKDYKKLGDDGLPL